MVTCRIPNRSELQAGIGKPLRHRRRLDDRRVGHRIRNDPVDNPLQIDHRSDMHARNETVLACHPVANGDLGNTLMISATGRKLARHRPDPQPCRQRQAESRRIDADRIALDRAVLLQAA